MEEYDEMKARKSLCLSRSEFLERIKLIPNNRPIYLTLDLDFFDPAFLPGTGTPEAGGEDFHCFISLVKILKDKNFVGADIVELAPEIDPTGNSSVFGTKVLRETAASLLLFFKEQRRRLMSWTIEQSDEFYGIGRWGENFFGVNQKGELSVYPERNDRSIQISIADVVKEMKDQHISFPAVIRFQDVLRSRVKDLNKAFKSAIDEHNYCANYRGVYPVKVNQMREVVEEIVDAGDQYSFGLEAGSKPELMSVLSMDQNLESLTILNGYKDEEYLRLAMIGRQMGRNIIIVVEKLSELKHIVEISKDYSERPLIGIRSRLGFKSVGKWEGSSGDKAKFGLSLSEIVHAIDYLKDNDYLENLKLFHFHIGSQIPSISSIQDAIAEGARTFVEISKLGAPLEFFDIGGVPLGINYDGSSSVSDSSINYSLEEYASDVVKTLMRVCDDEEIPHPNIVSESGRAITAHHSCVITKVIGEIDPSSSKVDVTKLESGQNNQYIENLKDSLSLLHKGEFVSAYNSISKIKQESYHAYKLGMISLGERALIEKLYWDGIKEVLSQSTEDDPSSELTLTLENLLTNQYLCNFSVFQSTADSWAIKQLLPVVPITTTIRRAYCSSKYCRYHLVTRMERSIIFTVMVKIKLTQNFIN